MGFQILLSVAWPLFMYKFVLQIPICILSLMNTCLRIVYVTYCLFYKIINKQCILNFLTRIKCFIYLNYGYRQCHNLCQFLNYTTKCQIIKNTIIVTLAAQRLKQIKHHQRNLKKCIKKNRSPRTSQSLAFYTLFKLAVLLRQIRNLASATTLLFYLLGTMRKGNRETRVWLKKLNLGLLKCHL